MTACPWRIDCSTRQPIARDRHACPGRGRLAPAKDLQAAASGSCSSSQCPGQGVRPLVTVIDGLDEVLQHKTAPVGPVGY